MPTDPMTQLDKPETLVKYKKAGEIACKVMNMLVPQIKRGARICDLCAAGDKMIQTEVAKIYTKLKKSRKGIAFPTCISVNNMVGHFSPYRKNKKGEKDPTRILEGDIVKIELGAHIDAFPAVMAYTVVVNETGELMTPEKASVVRAVSEAAKKIVPLMKPGNTNYDIVKVLQDTAKKHECNLPTIDANIHAPGVLSYQMSQFIVDGYNEDNDEYPHRFIMPKYSPVYDFEMEKLELEENEVYGIDIVMCSKAGKLKPSNYVTTIYRYVPEQRATLQLKSAAMVRNTFNNYRFPVNYADRLVGHTSSKYRFGLRECIKKRLVEPYHVVVGSQGEQIARMKFTVIVRDKPILIAARSMDEQVARLEKRE